LSASGSAPLSIFIQSYKSVLCLGEFSQNAQLRAPCKQPGPVSTLIFIAVGHPQQTPLWWKIATTRSFMLNGGIVTDTISAMHPEPGWCAVHSIPSHQGCC